MKRTWISFLALVALVVSASWFASGLWAGKTAAPAPPAQLVFTPGENLKDFMARNQVAPALARKVLGKADPAANLEAQLAHAGLTQGELQERLGKAAALAAEGEGKNWVKIMPKLGLWALTLLAMGFLVRRGWLDRRRRKAYYLGAVLVFGVVFGSDPSPMGTVKDALVLLGREGVVYPPRLIALAGFLLSVVLANKAICAWGCQLGVLQDLVFRLNARSRQVKVPFALSNSVRVAVFVALTAAAFVMGLDLIESIDPFKTFDPAHLGLAGAITAGALLVASLFVYRPWCHFACPFGLVGWLLERFSINRVRVDAQSCTSCGACAKACPSDAMTAILKRSKVVPDCFSCGSCQEACPSGAIRFGTRRP